MSRAPRFPIGAPQPFPHQHAEAFALMRYRCVLGHEEIVWNSRDGVTPFIISCLICRKEAHHVDWQADRYALDHRPAAGERFFRDGTPEEAAEIERRRIAAMRGRGVMVSEREEDQALQDARDGKDEWAKPGWPKLEVWGV